MVDKNRLFWNCYTYLGQLPLIFLPLGVFYYLTNSFLAFMQVLFFIGGGTVLGVTTKFFFFKDRPNPEQYSNFIERIKASSFPSIHTIRAFSIFVFSIWYYDLIGTFGLVFFGVYALGIMYSRVFLKKHFRVDILGGIVYVLFSFPVFWWMWSFLDIETILLGL